MDFHAHVSDVDKEGGTEQKIERERKSQRRWELKHLFTQQKKGKNRWTENKILSVSIGKERRERHVDRKEGGWKEERKKEKKERKERRKKERKKEKRKKETKKQKENEKLGGSEKE